MAVVGCYPLLSVRSPHLVQNYFPILALTHSLQQTQYFDVWTINLSLTCAISSSNSIFRKQTNIITHITNATRHVGWSIKHKESNFYSRLGISSNIYQFSQFFTSQMVEKPGKQQLSKIPSHTGATRNIATFRILKATLKHATSATLLLLWLQLYTEMVYLSANSRPL